MGQVLALKDWEAFESRKVEKSFHAEPASLISFQKKRSERIQQKKVRQWAQSGVYVLRVMLSDYEALMNQLAGQITAEQLAEITSLSAPDQIKEDLRRLNDWVNALEWVVLEKKGFSLAQAMEWLPEQGIEELSLVIDYLKTSEYPLFRAMMQVIQYTSVGGADYLSEKGMVAAIEELSSQGALDSVNGLQYLLENLFCEIVPMV
jgi:hypothetical protein